MQSPPAQFKHLTNISIGQISAKTKATNIKEEFWKISFTHHMLILNKCSTNPERFFYIEQAASLFWSVSVLEHHIQADLYSNQGKLPNNFASTLPDKLTPSALQVFQDEYLMDFITPPAVDDERVLENKVVSEIKNFILWMGKGFSFIGNQYRLEIDGEEFFIDLLFFNRHLQCLVAFELKRGKFKPEYAGQLNFYLNVLDEKVRLPHENPSIGIVLCKEKNNTIVEFAVRTIDKAMGVATYRTTKEVPKEMKGILPDAGELAKLL
jgi:predicted nuclease of restriction endonuclease-like (RecB) superfamily